VLAAWTGIPVYRLTEEETAKLLRMEDELHKRVIGQEEALKALSRAIRRTRAGLKDPKRPSGSFIFLGPTGVGKTELAKTLAEFLFDDEDALIQLDMSEYMEKHTVSRLVGSPPGYVGYEEGGQLTEAVRRKPFSVVLFDEVEKAHPDVFNTLLQILEDGRLTDAQGRSVDFKNTVLIMTSNLGTADLRKSSVGFAKTSEAVTYERMKAKVNEALKAHFRPEFLNRIDEVIVFHELSREEVTEIVDLLMARTIDQLSDQGIGLELTPAARAFLAEKGYDPSSGRGRCAGPSSSWSRTRCPSASCGRSSGSARRSSSTWRSRPSTARGPAQLPGHRGHSAPADGAGRRRRGVRGLKRNISSPLLSPGGLGPSCGESTLVTVERGYWADQVRPRGSCHSLPRVPPWPDRSRSTSAQSCEGVAPQWVGRCPHCGEWNTLMAVPTGRRAGSRRPTSPSSNCGPPRCLRARRRPEARPHAHRRQRARPGPGRRLRGRFGHPGLRAARRRQVDPPLPGAGLGGRHRASMSCPGLGRGVAGPGQRRATRIGPVPENLLALAGHDVAAIEAAIEHHRPALVVVDSIQSISDDACPRRPGAWPRSEPASSA
jgi:energy-coupling factor transporter ATP-binding protein EcfA2